MSYEEKKQIITTFFEAYNAHDWDRLVDLFAESLIFRNPRFPEPQIGAAAWRPGGAVREWMEANITQMPDLHAEVEHIFGEDKWFCGAGLFVGTHMETQKSVQLPFSQIIKVDEGKITEIQVYFDLLRLQTQLSR